MDIRARATKLRRFKGRDRTYHAALYARFRVSRVCVRTNWNFRTICAVLTPRWTHQARTPVYEEQSRNALLSKSCERRDRSYCSIPADLLRDMNLSYVVTRLRLIATRATRWIKIPSFKKVLLNAPALARKPLVRFSRISFPYVYAEEKFNVNIENYSMTPWISEDEREGRWLT